MITGEKAGDVSIDLQQARRDTPGCTTVLHFNNAGAALMPQPVLDAPSERGEARMADSRLRRLAEERRAALVPGVYSALTACQAEIAVFEAVYATGAGIANSLLAAPDLGLTSFKEVLDQVQYMVDAVEVPVIVDADTGFGNALSVRRVVKALERAVRFGACTCAMARRLA